MIFLFTTILILFISSNYFTMRISHSLFYSHVWYCFTIWIYFILHHHFECLLSVLSLFFLLRLSNEHLAAVIETIFSILELPPFCLVQVEGTHLDRVSVKVRNKETSGLFVSPSILLCNFFLVLTKKTLHLIDLDAFWGHFSSLEPTHIYTHTQLYECLIYNSWNEYLFNFFLILIIFPNKLGVCDLSEFAKWRLLIKDLTTENIV